MQFHIPLDKKFTGICLIAHRSFLWKNPSKWIIGASRAVQDEELPQTKQY